MRPEKENFLLCIFHVFLDLLGEEVKVEERSYDHAEDGYVLTRNYTEYRDPAFDRGVTFGI